MGFFGEMKIVFNDTIKVDFNYSDLNASCVDIMIESKNITVKNWTLISIDFYNLMTFKLYFEDPLNISPEINQDQIVFKIKNESIAK